MSERKRERWREIDRECVCLSVREREKKINLVCENKKIVSLKLVPFRSIEK